MRRIWNLALILSLLLPFGVTTDSQALTPTSSVEEYSTERIDGQPAQDPPVGGGMPGWPVLEVPIPYHKPGRPSRAGSYSTRVVHQNEMGLDEVVQVTGLDALLVDGVVQDPFQGNYRLVEENQIHAGLLNTSSSTLGTQTVDVEGGELNRLADTEQAFAPVIQTDVTAGDLNGDGIDEQITAWIDNTSGDLHLTIGEMAVSSDLAGEVPPKVTAQPAAVGYGDGSMDVVVRGYDGALWHQHFDGSDWGEWSNAGGGLLLSGPAIVSRGIGQFDVFAYSFDPADSERAIVYARHFESGVWTAPWTPVDVSDPGLPINQPLPLPTLPAPVAIVRDPGQVDLFWLNQDHTLHWCGYDGSTCASDQNLGGMLASGPGAVALGSSEMMAFARGVDDSIWYRTYNSGWGDWKLLEMPAGITPSSAPSAVKTASGQVSLFVQVKDSTSVDSPHTLYHNSLTGSAWAGWQLIWEYDDTEPFEKLGSGIGAAYPSGAIKIFAQMENGSLGLAEYNGSLSDWTISSLPASTEFEVSLIELGGDPDLRSPLKLEAGHYWGAGRELYVVAYVTATREISVNLFDIGGGGDGFTPNLLGNILLNVEYTTADGQDDMDLAAGDVNGDGKEDIIVASIEAATRTGDLWLNVLEVDCDSEACTLTNQPHPGESPPWAQFADAAVYVSTVHLASGDMNGDGDDEVAVYATGFWIGGDSWRPRLFLIDDGEIVDDIYLDICDFDDGDAMHPGPCTSGDLAVGNFKEEATSIKDEIAIFTPVNWNCLGTSSNQCWRWYRALVYQFDGVDLTQAGWYDEPGSNWQWITGTGLYATPVDQGAVLLSDLDADFLDEMVLARCYGATCTSYLFEPITLASPPPSNPLAPSSTSDLNPGSPYDRAYLAAGDFLSESLRVGPPTLRIQEQMTTPIAFLNLPPMHRDLVWNDSSSQYDLVELFNGATAVYSTGDLVENASTNQSYREWGLSTGLETTVGAFGSSVTASLDNTYGENFSNLSSTIQSNAVNKTITADLYDQVIYNGTTYRIWEYPVLGIPEADKAGPTTVSVVYPFDFGDPLITNPEINAQYPLICDKNFYAPGHQTFNVWSYDASGEPSDFKDYSELLVHDQTSGGSGMSLTIDTKTEEERTASFHNQFSAGVEYSYENSLDIPLIGKAWDFSFRAYAKGSYGWEDVSTLGTTLDEVTEFSIDMPSSTCANTTDSYLYKAEAGYYVVDYQTMPDPLSSCWSLYDKPDPAFTLNWYGFPDPGSPVDPPCGEAMKLFSHDLKIVPQYAKIGDDVIISAVVRNFSPIPTVEEVIVKFYRGVPAPENELGSDTISGLDRATGSKTASITILWDESYGVGKQQIYAVIDPEDAIDEVHQAGDLIDNNTAFGYIYIAGADYLDPGLRESMPYQALALDVGEGISVSAYLPTTNDDVTERFELVPRPIIGISIPGEPFRLDAFAGGQASPPALHDFDPVPAVIGLHAPGRDVSGLTLFRYTGTGWEDATCSGHQTRRFPSEDLLFVPLCNLTYSLGSEHGTFALSDIEPNLAPEADFDASPLSGPSPLEVQFEDLSPGNPTSWTWDFGDSSELCYDQDPVHEFSDPGLYTVTLTVENAFGSDVETKVAYINVVEEHKLYLPLILR